MRIRALVQAGGAGERMRRSFGACPKPLVPVAGVPLLERNLYALLRAGLREIAVAVPAARPEIGRFVAERAVPIAKALGAELSLLEESTPLGTLGAAGELRDAADVLLVVNADNLTALDLRAILDDHLRGGAALTIATHWEVDRFPFGEVCVDGDRVTDYREKPERRTLMCSAVSVLAPRALRALARGEPAGLPALVLQLIAAGDLVRAFHHDAPWIDVNDADAVGRAEALVARHAAAFELWAPRVDVEVVGAVLLGEGGVLLEQRASGARSYAGLWDTPGGKIEPGETPGQAIARELREELGLTGDWDAPIVAFDDVDPGSGLVSRHHVFARRVEAALVRPREGQRVAWIADPAALDAVSPVVARSLAALPRAR